jgi:hypothetical protein
MACPSTAGASLAQKNQRKLISFFSNLKIFVVAVALYAKSKMMQKMTVQNTIVCGAS